MILKSSNSKLKHRRWIAAALGLATAAALAGCAGPAADSDSDTENVTIGVMGTFTAQGGVAYPGIPRVIEETIADLNDAGGIGGKQVKIVTCDDQYLPDQVTRCARQMTDSGAVAVVTYTLFADKISPILVPDGLAYFPGWPLLLPDVTSEASFPVTTGTMTQMGAAWLAAQECEDSVLITPESPATEMTKNLVQIGSEAGGGSMPKVVTTPLSTTDFAPYAAQLVADNPDCILAFGSEAINLVLYPAIEQTGWKDRDPSHRIIGYLGGTYTDRLLEEFPELLDNLLGVDTAVPFSDPVWADFNATVDDLESEDLGNLRGGATRGAYIGLIAALDVINQVIEAGDPVTKETVLDMLNTTDAVSTGGLTPDFAPKDGGLGEFTRLFNTSVIVNKVQDGHIVADGDFVDLRTDLQDAMGE